MGLLVDLNPHKFGIGSVMSEVLIRKFLQGKSQQTLQPHGQGMFGKRLSKVNQKFGWQQDQIPRCKPEIAGRTAHDTVPKCGHSLQGVS